MDTKKKKRKCRSCSQITFKRRRRAKRIVGMHPTIAVGAMRMQFGYAYALGVARSRARAAKTPGTKEFYTKLADMMAKKPKRNLRGSRR